MQTKQFLLIICVWISLMGCGYTLVDGSSSRHSSPPTLALVSLENQTYEPEIEQYIHTAFRHEFLRTRRFILVAANAAAQWYLSGSIKYVRTVPIAFDRGDHVLQYQTEVSVFFQLAAAIDHKPFFSQEIIAKANYLVEPGGGTREEIIARETAFLQLAQTLANQCADLLAIALL